MTVTSSDDRTTVNRPSADERPPAPLDVFAPPKRLEPDPGAPDRAEAPDDPFAGTDPTVADRLNPDCDDPRPALPTDELLLPDPPEAVLELGGPPWQGPMAGDRLRKQVSRQGAGHPSHWASHKAFVGSAPT